MATSVASVSSVRDRSASPIARLDRPIDAYQAAQRQRVGFSLLGIAAGHAPFTYKMLISPEAMA
ncbi:MAG: hypothetical protein JO266_18835 [Acidobacteria bacterium]|nr:hypothetical protein [Acidobacteriota bacterium]